MCLFPLPNNNYNSEAYRRGITEYACGGCPECMTSRSNKLMLRDVFEASQHEHNCMCTLTYDSYIRDEQGRIVGEKLNLRKVDVRDCQLFIKRMRRFVERKYGVTFKYRLSAEYGKKTHRPHYHVLFFGWTFPDVVPYKKSKRGNWIYTSAMLTKLWKYGICTVDAVKVTPAIAKYCSKYSSKDHGAEDTFSLCSHHIGIDALYKKFNGLWYMVEGRKYSIPREIWQLYITDCYKGGPVDFSTKYINGNERTHYDGSYFEGKRLNANYRMVRDADPLYQAYLVYWNNVANTFKQLQPNVFERIRQLPDNQYHFYKVKALEVLKERLNNVPVPAPRSNQNSAYRYYLWNEGHLLEDSRLNRANDTFFLRKHNIKLEFDFGDNPFDCYATHSIVDNSAENVDNSAENVDNSAENVDNSA